MIADLELSSHISHSHVSLNPEVQDWMCNHNLNITILNIFFLFPAKLIAEVVIEPFGSFGLSYRNHARVRHGKVTVMQQWKLSHVSFGYTIKP